MEATAARRARQAADSRAAGSVKPPVARERTRGWRCACLDSQRRQLPAKQSDLLHLFLSQRSKILLQEHSPSGTIADSGLGSVPDPRRPTGRSPWNSGGARDATQKAAAQWESSIIGIAAAIRARCRGVVRALGPTLARIDAIACVANVRVVPMRGACHGHRSSRRHPGAATFSRPYKFDDHEEATGSSRGI